jgi:hypothetical protein
MSGNPTQLATSRNQGRYLPHGAHLMTKKTKIAKKNKSFQPSIPTSDSEETPYYTVGIRKLSVMLFFTGGIYQLYWFYQQWKHARNYSNIRVRPFIRAWFSIFFCYSLFKRINQDALDRGLESKMSPSTGFLVLFISTLGGIFPFPLQCVIYLGLFIILPFQRMINEINIQEIPEHDPNETLSFANYVWIAFSIVLTLGAGYLKFVTSQATSSKILEP